MFWCVSDSFNYFFYWCINLKNQHYEYKGIKNKVEIII